MQGSVGTLWLTALEWMVWRTRCLHVIGKGRLLLALSPRDGERVVPIIGDYRLLLDLGDHLQRLMYLGLLHHDLLPAFRLLLPPGGTFLDVGANIGFFTLYGQHCVGEEGRVIAIEAIPRTFAKLLDSLDRNRLDRVEAHCLALCDSDGPFVLHVPPAALKKDYLVSHHAEGWEPVTVPGRTLASLLDEQSIACVDFMKIDIEGAEPLVFAAAESVLRAGRVRAMMCEFTGAHLAVHGLTVDEAVDRVLGLGFRLVAFGRDGQLHECKRTPRFDDRRDYNLLFRHESSLSKQDN